MGYEERRDIYLLDKQGEGNATNELEKEWNESVLPKITLFNQLGIEDVLKDIKDDIWQTGEIINFSTPKEDFLNRQLHTPHIISCSLSVREPIVVPGYIDYNKSVKPYISSSEYGITVESKGGRLNNGYIILFRAKLPCLTNPNDYHQDRLLFINTSTPAILIQNSIIDIWENYITHPDSNLRYLKEFNQRGIDPEVIKLIKKGCSIPKEFEYLEKYK